MANIPDYLPRVLSYPGKANHLKSKRVLINARPMFLEGSYQVIFLTLENRPILHAGEDKKREEREIKVKFDIFSLF